MPDNECSFLEESALLDGLKDCKVVWQDQERQQIIMRGFDSQYPYEKYFRLYHRDIHFRWDSVLIPEEMVAQKLLDNA